MSAIKQDLTQQDEAKILEQIKDSNMYEQERFRRQSKFSIGDIIIKQSPKYDDDYQQVGWKNDPISSINSAAQRYKVVFVDEFEIPWIKKISAKDGTLCENIVSLIGYSGQGTRFTADPDHANSILLGEEYDPAKYAEDARKLTKQIQKENKAKILKFKDYEEANEFFKGLKVGDILWRTSNHHNKYFADKDEVLNYKIKITRVFKPRSIDRYAKMLDGQDAYVQNKCSIGNIYIIEYVTLDYNNKTWDTDIRTQWCFDVSVKKNDGFYRDIFYKDEPSYAKKF